MKSIAMISLVFLVGCALMPTERGREHQRILRIQPDWPQEMKVAVRNGYLRHGMTPEMVEAVFLVSSGSYSITRVATESIERIYWQLYQNHWWKDRYFTVTFLDGKVIAWIEKD
jgi:hypothetical protein